ncbi:hypothetical protein [Paraconexibacter sp.]|uniref:hypothetical protein n=1 Tax=Paraconexibacter sp. TaxID=2949640 RepID=UPI0035675A56
MPRQPDHTTRTTAVLVLAALAALALPAGATAATSASGNQSVTADIANTLEATFPGAYSWGNLDAGTTGNTSSEQTLTVKSNAAWGVKVASDLVDGKMKEWTGVAYVPVTPKVLTNALTWRLSTLGGAAQGTSFASLSSVQALVTGTQAATNDSGVGVGVTYKQVVSYADANAGVNDYRILVSYDVAQGY